MPTTRPAEKRGLILPFRREKGDFANATEADLILANARLVLGTRCSDGTVNGPKGELPWNPFFGSLLYKLRHQNVTEVIKYQALAYVVDALSRWEPRVRVRDVSVLNEDRRLIIRTTLVIVDVGGRGVSDENHTIENEVLKAAA